MPRAHEDEKVEKKDHAVKDDSSDVIWVTEFTPDSARDFCEKLFEQSKEDRTKPIVIYIDSYGGGLHELMTMITAIDSVPNQIITVCMGKAMSAGSALLSHGDIRYVNKFSRVMIHEASAGLGGNVNDMRNDMKDLDHANDMFLGLIAENCGKTLKQLKKKFTNRTRDLFLTADEAIAFGVADKLGVPQIKKITRYEVA